MFEYKIVGTSHVSKESEKRIEAAIESFKPDIIGIELDSNRLHGLLSNEKAKLPPKLIFKIGLWGYIFSVVGKSFQEKIGKKLGIVPGQDMLSAVFLAKKYNIPAALIDQNIHITLQHLSRNFKRKDKWNLTKDIFKSIFMRKKVIKEMGLEDFDLSAIPEDALIEKMIDQIKVKYPGVHKAIIHDRNIYMANRMFAYLKNNPEKRYLAVVGAGHKKEMEKILNKRLLNLEYIK